VGHSVVAGEIAKDKTATRPPACGGLCRLVAREARDESLSRPQLGRVAIDRQCELAERLLLFGTFESHCRCTDAAIATDRIDFVLRHDPTGPFRGLSHCR
jgi:hypothetical protein